MLQPAQAVYKPVMRVKQMRESLLLLDLPGVASEHLRICFHGADACRQMEMKFVRPKASVLVLNNNPKK